ncbi:polyphosphate polymerase domain-containing protein [Cohnella cholangitidis]|uniref:Polyphosphate polymerase domain-containing protein n=1 Tax=Cohnella cholangitidis TaxID=2598458 RepID=A0A7G5BW66_9BACL|nr:polyphosphate polymerase domain-containing protein [Cohnella cholangitidis]QMV41200.1 polyphosphate polymerase domain-containing protein [Cohnella cholangitidis]
MRTDLKYRHELKYYMNPYQYQVMKRQLRHLLRLDKHAGAAGDYHIRSLYFDDIDNKALHEKLAGVRDREKYRIRIYNRSDKVIHLEKKIKFNDYISKVKEPLTREMYDSILAGDYECLNDPAKPLLAEMYYQMKNKLLRPKVIVDYVREAYVCGAGNVRITFDKQLKTGLNRVDIFDPHLSMINAFDDDITVFEVKFDEYLPEYVRTAIQTGGLVRQSNSKYVLCKKLIKFNSWEDQ